MCASVTCSNGTGSGLIVPGTGVHVNNMLGEQDLNPLGFHRHDPGRRLPSMMSPTVVLRDGELEAGLGSGGSNRIRSAVLQTILRLTDGLDVAEAVWRPGSTSRTAPCRPSPASTRPRSARLESRGYEVVRWPTATSSSAASTPSRGTRPRASSAAAETRGAGAPWRWRSSPTPSVI